MRWWVTLVLFSACGGGGDAADAGPATDGAARIDSGPPSDSGAALDAEPGVDAGPTDETADPETFFAAVMRQACEVARRCETYGESTFMCHPGYPSHLWDMALAAWRAGRARFDQAAARAFLEEIREPGRCFGRGSLDPGPVSWFDVFVGLGTADSPCSDGIGAWSPDCAPGLSCVNEGVCPGRCTPLAVAGQPCDALHACAREALCSGGTCAARSALGALCDPEPCELGLSCVDGSCRAGAAGDPCRSNSDCQYPNRCAIATDTCENAYGTEEGDLCEPFQIPGCRFPLHCLGPDSVGTGIDHFCGAGVPLGAACDDGNRCEPGGRCVEGACREIVGSRAACDATHVCPEIHDCVDGTCVPWPTVGESCATHRCIFGSCVDDVCVPEGPAVGEECSPDPWYCGFGSRCTDEGTRFVCTERCP